MKAIIRFFLLVMVTFSGVLTLTLAGDCPPGTIQLNTDVPGLADSNRCVKVEEAGDVFGNVMGGLMKLLINITVAVAFISLIAAGIMYSMSGVNQSVAGKGKELIKKVIIGIILLGMSGIILHTINPNFFKSGMVFYLLIRG